MRTPKTGYSKRHDPPSECPDRKLLKDRLEQALRTYDGVVRRMQLIYGTLEGERHCEGNYQRCVEARDALRKHEREHECVQLNATAASL